MVGAYCGAPKAWGSCWRLAAVTGAKAVGTGDGSWGTRGDLGRSWLRQLLRLLLPGHPFSEQTRHFRDRGCTTCRKQRQSPSQIRETNTGKESPAVYGTVP
jgi:hypothetical protein